MSEPIRKLGPIICEWCGTFHQTSKGLLTSQQDSDLKKGEYRSCGYCPQCGTDTWSKVFTETKPEGKDK